MTDRFKVCDKTQSEYLDKTFPHEGKGTWYDITDMLTQCDVVDSCEDCPRYGDDCDGEVVMARGKWIPLGHQIGFLKHPWSEDYRCSLCGYEAYTIGTPPPKVCPQCHANNIIDKINDVIEERNEVIE